MTAASATSQSSTFIAPNDPSITNQILNENSAGDCYAPRKKQRDPYFFERADSGEWRVVPWLEPRVSRQAIEIGLQLLRDHGWVARADAIVSCGRAFIPFKGCLEVGPDGRWHELHAVLGFCNTAFCPHCSEPTRRLDHFLNLDNNRIFHAIYQIANTLTARNRPTSIKRITLGARTVKATRGLSFRQRQESLQKHIDKWRERLCRQYGVGSEEHGILIADGLRKQGAGARLFYVGPDIPDTIMAKTWADIVGMGWEFQINSGTICAHEISTDEVGFRGLLEAELQRLMESNHHFVSMLRANQIVEMNVMFRNYRMVRRIGSFYGQKISEAEVMIDTEPSEMTEAEIDAVINAMPVVPSELGLCATCQHPLVPFLSHKPSNYQDLDAKAREVKYYQPRKRQEHKHSSVHKCVNDSRLRGEIAALMSHSPPI